MNSFISAVASWTLLSLLSAFIGLVVTVWFESEVQDFLASLSWIPAKQNSIEGKWISVFTLKRGGKIEYYCETIELKSAFNKVYGRMRPSDRKTPVGRDEEFLNSQKIITRLRGEFKDKTFKGEWYHPSMTKNTQGILLLKERQPGGAGDFQVLKGVWLGYVDATWASVDSGDWYWVRYDDATWLHTIRDENYLNNLKQTKKGAMLDR